MKTDEQIHEGIATAFTTFIHRSAAGKAPSVIYVGWHQLHVLRRIAGYEFVTIDGVHKGDRPTWNGCAVYVVNASDHIGFA